MDGSLCLSLHAVKYIHVVKRVMTFPNLSAVPAPIQTLYVAGVGLPSGMQLAEDSNNPGSYFGQTLFKGTPAVSITLADTASVPQMSGSQGPADFIVPWSATYDPATGNLVVSTVVPDMTSGDQYTVAVVQLVCVCVCVCVSLTRVSHARCARARMKQRCITVAGTKCKCG